MSRKRTRANGEGSVYRAANGDWHGELVVGRKPDGRLDRRHRRGKTRKEVLAKLDALRDELRHHGAPTVGVRWTVNDWVRHYVEDIRGQALAPRTRLSYLSHLSEHIGPAIGHYLLPDLRPEHVELVFERMLDRGCSSVTCERVRATLRASFNAAIRRNLMTRNVAALAQVPAARRTPTRVLTLSVEEARAVLSAAGEDEARWALALMGMRPGEVLGLDWRDVDLEQGRITICQQLIAAYPYEHGCPTTDTACRKLKGRNCPQRQGGRQLTKPKSTSGNRVIVLPEPLLELLKAHRKRWLVMRMRAANCWQDQWGELVFVQPTGAPLSATQDREAWNTLLQTTGIEHRRLYDARHTAGTLLLEAGADIFQVKEQLGHSQISLTSRYYLHTTNPLRADSARRLGGQLFGVSDPETQATSQSD